MKRTKFALAGGIGAVALTAGLWIASLTPPGPTITLAWDNPQAMTPGTVTEVWSCTNLLTSWQLKTNVATNRLTLPRDKPAEFFKIRNRSPDGLVSDWSRRTN